MNTLNPDILMIHYINKEECNALISENEYIQIIDLRDESDFRLGHIPRAVHLDIMQNGSYVKLKSMDIKGDYLFYCNSGLRTNSVSKIIQGLGFENVYMLREGLKDWDGELVTE